MKAHQNNKYDITKTWSLVQVCVTPPPKKKCRPFLRHCKPVAAAEKHCRESVVLTYLMMIYEVQFDMEATYTFTRMVSRCSLRHGNSGLLHSVEVVESGGNKFTVKTFQAAQLTHERFLTLDHSCKIFFLYLPNWTSQSGQKKPTIDF